MAGKVDATERGAASPSPFAQGSGAPARLAQVDQSGRGALPNLEGDNRALRERVAVLEEREREFVKRCSAVMLRLPLTMELFEAQAAMQGLLELIPPNDETSSLAESARGSIVSFSRLEQKLREAKQIQESLKECAARIGDLIDPAKPCDLQCLNRELAHLKKVLEPLEKTQNGLADPVSWEMRRLGIECTKKDLYPEGEAFEFIRIRLESLKNAWDALRRETVCLKSLKLLGTSVVEVRSPLEALKIDYTHVSEDLSKRSSEFGGSTGQPLSPRNLAFVKLIDQKKEGDARYTALRSTYLSTFDNLATAEHLPLHNAIQTLWDNCNQQSTQCQVLIEKIQKEQVEIRPVHQLIKEVYDFEAELKGPLPDLAKIRTHEETIKKLTSTFLKLCEEKKQERFQTSHTKIQGALFRSSLLLKQLELKWAQNQVTEMLHTLSPAHVNAEQAMQEMMSSSVPIPKAHQTILKDRTAIRPVLEKIPPLLPHLAEMMRKIATVVTLKDSFYEEELRKFAIPSVGLLTMSLKADCNSHHALLQKEAAELVATLRTMLTLAWNLEDYFQIYDCLLIPSQDISARLVVAASLQAKIQPFITVIGKKSEDDMAKGIALVSEHVAFEQARNQTLELYERLTSSLEVPWPERKWSQRREFLQELPLLEAKSETHLGCSPQVQACMEKCQALFKKNEKDLRDQAESLTILISMVSSILQQKEIKGSGSPSLPRRPSGSQQKD